MFNYSLLVSAIVFVCLDAVYLNFMKDYFNKQVQDVQGTKIQFNLLAALICYIFLIYGLNYFIIRPKKSASDAFLLGLVIYGVYETTNWAIFTKWSPLSVIMDTLWGGILFWLTTTIVQFLRLN
jgi:uncharacterized membrane protein